MKLSELLNDIDIAIGTADAVRSLFTESVVDNPLKKALGDVAKTLQGKKYALIGGLAVGLHARPRGTDDVDILISSEDELGGIKASMVYSGLFKTIRDHAVIHKSTHVEIEILTPEFLKQNRDITDTALGTATTVPFQGTSIPVASAKSLILLKMKRSSYKDLSDIENIIKAGVDDISDITQDAALLQKFEDIKAGITPNLKD